MVHYVEFADLQPQSQGIKVWNTGRKVSWGSTATLTPPSSGLEPIHLFFGNKSIALQVWMPWHERR